MFEPASNVRDSREFGRVLRSAASERLAVDAGVGCIPGAKAKGEARVALFPTTPLTAIVSSKRTSTAEC